VAAQTRLVVGLGNPLAGSDGFGAAVVARLRELGGLPAGVALIDAGTDLMGHLNAFLAYDHVVLVDAVVGAGHPGDVTTIEETVFGSWPASAASCHHLSPLVAVKLFRALHPQAGTRVTLVGYCADEITLGPGLPEAAVAAGAAAVGRLIVAA
jgi:hydrogenase maturation protease